MLKFTNVFLIVGSIFLADLASACMEKPKRIRHESSTFPNEVFSFAMGTYGPTITNGSSKLFFNPIKNQWCKYSFSKNEESEATPECLTNSAKIKLNSSDDADKVVGHLIVRDNRLLFFSTHDGEPTNKKPYMRVEAEYVFSKTAPPEYTTTLRAETVIVSPKAEIDGGLVYVGKRGKYEEDGKFTSSEPRSRGGLAAVAKAAAPVIDVPVPVMALNGKRIDATASCGLPSTKPFGLTDGGTSLPAVDSVQ